MTRARDLLILTAFTLALHLPFLAQPVQGDEVNYLDVARNVLQHPLTPQDFHFVFQGEWVDMAGHPHPPMNAYLLAIPLLAAGRVSVFWFHAWYLLFAIGISCAAYALASYFTAQPLWGALLVAASPIVQVNTNTLAGPESPGLAFLLVGAAAFFWRRFWISGIALTLAGLTELQALALPPILLLEYAVRRKRPPRAAWLALAAPYAGMAAWQALQFGLTQRLPGAVLVGYMRDPSRGRPTLKGASALALLQHLGILVTLVPLAWRRLWGIAPGIAAAFLVHGYPWWERALLALFVSLGVNALVWLWSARRDQPVLAGWCLLYFAFAAAAFYSGAARYLLPLAAPMVLLFVLTYHQRTGWMALALGFNLFLGLNISLAAYEFARVYADVEPPPAPFLVNGEWGFRYHMLARGGRMLESHSVPNPGEWIVSSELSLAGNHDSLAEETAVPLRTVDLRVPSPLRLIDRYAHTGFSSVSAGLLPFSFSTRPLDRISYARTSQFLYAPGDWRPTQSSGRLVYLPGRGATVRLPLAAAQLHFALFAQGRGRAAFRIADPSGSALFDKTAAIDGSLWDVHTLPVAGAREVLLSVDASPGIKAGWGELVALGDHPKPAPAPAPSAHLDMGDIRARAQLLSGWYAIEEGAWRWMAARAEAVLGTPASAAPVFEMRLYFPPDHMQRAGGPVTVSVSINGHAAAKETYSAPGGYQITAAVPAAIVAPANRVSIQLNRAIAPGIDRRELGAVVQDLGFIATK